MSGNKIDRLIVLSRTGYVASCSDGKTRVLQTTKTSVKLGKVLLDDQCDCVHVSKAPVSLWARSSTSSTNDRAWDIVVLGATGDAGMAISTYIADNYETYTKGGSNRLRWAIAGRSKAKLEIFSSFVIFD